MGWPLMFGRRRPETEDPKMVDEADDLGIPMKPTRPGGSSASVATVGKGPPPLPPRAADPPRPPEPPRPAPEPPLRAAELPRRATDSPTAQRRHETDVRKLIVGREITLTGEITACDKLTVEGTVEANLQNCRDIDISESGMFKGAASVDEADVRGRFEGNLTVRKRLVIRGGGRVSGTIRYAQIEIESGGQISGDVQVQPSNEPAGALAEAATTH